ncbi:hypothetical protein [Coleofasciculus sp.]|uniref:hypothetical protein n=1 Tax=Coleofasciculus sp. TaxID=3100458 RepID=UPI0039F84C18
MIRLIKSGLIAGFGNESLREESDFRENSAILGENWHGVTGQVWRSRKTRKIELVIEVGIWGSRSHSWTPWLGGTSYR